MSRKGQNRYYFTKARSVTEQAHALVRRTSIPPPPRVDPRTPTDEFEVNRAARRALARATRRNQN